MVCGRGRWLGEYQWNGREEGDEQMERDSAGRQRARGERHRDVGTLKSSVYENYVLDASSWQLSAGRTIVASIHSLRVEQSHKF
jgi:hypothetical protein